MDYLQFLLAQSRERLALLENQAAKGWATDDEIDELDFLRRKGSDEPR